MYFFMIEGLANLLRKCYNFIITNPVQDQIIDIKQKNIGIFCGQISDFTNRINRLIE